MKRLLLFALLLLPASFSMNAYSQNQNPPVTVKDCQASIETSEYCKVLGNLFRTGTYLYHALKIAKQPQLATATSRISYDIVTVFEYIANQNSRAGANGLKTTQQNVITLFDYILALDNNTEHLKLVQEALLLYSNDFRVFVDYSNQYIKFLQENGK